MMGMARLDEFEQKLVAVVKDTMTDPLVDKRAVAESCGISVVLLTRALNGESRLSAGTWKKICNLLKIDYEKIAQLCEVPTEADEPKAEPKSEPKDDGWPMVVTNEKKPQGITVNAPPEELYRLFLFAEERLQDNLRLGTRMPAEELYKLMQTMYALRDAALALQPGEVVAP